MSSGLKNDKVAKPQYSTASLLTMDALRGNCTSNKNLGCFCALYQNYQQIFKNSEANWLRNSKMTLNFLCAKRYLSY